MQSLGLGVRTAVQGFLVVSFNEVCVIQSYSRSYPLELLSAQLSWIQELIRAKRRLGWKSRTQNPSHHIREIFGAVDPRQR